MLRATGFKPVVHIGTKIRAQHPPRVTEPRALRTEGCSLRCPVGRLGGLADPDRYPRSSCLEGEEVEGVTGSRKKATGDVLGGTLFRRGV